VKERILSSLKTASIWAAIVAIAGYVIGPTLYYVAVGAEITDKWLTLRLVIGFSWFLILSLIIFLYKFFTFAKEETDSADKQDKQTSDNSSSLVDEGKGKPASIWNYVWLVIAAVLLLGGFVPQLISGTFERQYLIGVAFWVVIIIYCSINIMRSERRSA
jgi:hypothetical protein